MGKYQDQRCLVRQFYKEQCKKWEEEADKRRVGRITPHHWLARWKFSTPKIIWRKKKRLNGGKGLLGPWHPHNDYRISAKIGESRNKWFLETTESWVQNYSKQKEINSSQLPILEPVLKPSLPSYTTQFTPILPPPPPPSLEIIPCVFIPECGSSRVFLTESNVSLGHFNHF